MQNQIKPGIYDIPENEYHSGKYDEWVSAHQLMPYLKSAAHGKAAKTEKTTAMEFGSAIHLAILENKEDEIIVFDGSSRKTKAFKALREDKPDNIILLEPEMEQLKAIKESVLNHPIGKQLITGEVEKSLFWIENDIKLRGRADVILKKHKIIVDLKTAADASEEAFSRAVANYNYDLQAAQYISAVEHLISNDFKFIWLVVEKEPPYAVASYMADEPLLRVGEAKRQICIKRLSESLKTGSYKAYPEEIKLISLPSWEINKYL